MENQEYNMIFDWHIHSKYSYDSLMSPKKITEVALKKGLDCIAITDHDSIKGAVVARQYENERIKILIGEEVFTDHGDLIGINIEKEIQEKNFFKAIKEIKKQKGISILPHPYKGHKRVNEIARHVDIIEAYNSRISEELNRKAKLLSSKLKKTFLVGSDAHFYCEIGNSKNILDQSFSFNFSSTSSWTIPASQIIKATKARRIKAIVPNLITLLRNINSCKDQYSVKNINNSFNCRLLSEFLINNK